MTLREVNLYSISNCSHCYRTYLPNILFLLSVQVIIEFLCEFTGSQKMSDHQAGTGPHPSPQNLNVASGQTVRIQQVLASAPQNVNVLTTRGQQFVITSHVNVPGLTQVLPTIAGSNAGIQQGVTRILNISQSPRVNVVGVSQVPGRTGSVQLANNTSNNAPGEVSGRGAVSLVAISQPPTVNAASHPTLVSTLSSPPRQRTTNSLGIMQSSPTLVLASPPTVRSPSNPHGTLSHPAVSQSTVSHLSGSRKRIRLTEMQERTPPSEEVAATRKRIQDHKTLHLSAVREQFAEFTAELFFLQHGGNMMDYFSWRKRPPSAQFLHFLRTNPLDPEDDDEDLTQVLSTSLSTPSASVDIKPNVTNTLGSSMSSPAPPPCQQVPDTSAVVPVSSGIVTVTTNTSTNMSPVKQSKSPVTVRQYPKPHSISAVYDTSLGSQEQIAEKAKQEAYVMQRIVELQKEGLWSEKRLPKVQEPPRAKAHWDYLVEEMVWLAADFAQERKWKKAAAKKCARSIQKYFQEKAIQAQKAEKTQELRLRKIANFIAKEVKTFWTNVEKLVEYKQQTRLEEKRKKVLDQHLSFIVDQTEKYSTWLAESMNKPGDTVSHSVPPSVNSSVLSSPSRPDGVTDDEFQPNQSSTDDEETIAKAEEDMGSQGNSDEIEMLKRESELPLEDLLKELPEDYLENRDKLVSEGKSDDEKSVSNDDEFVASDGESTDDEETIQEQETMEGTVDHKEELAALEAEGEMSLEELLAKYGGPDCLDAEVQDDQDNETDEKSDSESECEAEDGEGTDAEDEKSCEESEVGLKSLLDDTSTSVNEQNEKNAAAGKEITDVAALAESIQPKGNTLSSTNVVTTIPFLLKHTLREYQHIGLDWLVTMFDRKLNGILADEMGLGKTIQTISLLAHLACEKGNWGPHLIIVPTSVMLNWEMEFKKWCPAFKILTYYGTQKERKQKRTGWTKPNAFHVCITSYKLVIQDHQSFRRKKWKYLILDEAQNIKNFKSQRWQLLLNFQTQRRLLLTGTPLQNNLMELWSLMHFLMPNVFQSHREFKEWFSNPVTGMIEGNSEYNDSIIKRLHKVLRPFLLRRLKTEVEKQLPKKYEHIVMCRLSKRQRFLYDDFMSRAKTKETLATGNLLSVINVLMQLRKVCNHPNLFEVRPTVSPFQMEGILYVTSSLVYSALNYDPFKHVNFTFMNLLLVELETSLTAFVAHRLKKFCVPKQRIEEIDKAPECAPRCPAGKIKINVRYTYNQQPISSASSLLLNKGLALNIAGSRMGASPLLKSVLPQGLGQGVTLRVTGGNQMQGYSVQLVQQQGGLKAIPVATLGPTQQVSGTTVQQTQQLQGVPKQDGMQRITLPAGFAQLVQTSTGRHHILFTSQQMVQAGSSQNIPTTTTVLTASGQRLTVVPKSVGNVATTSISSGSRMVSSPGLARPVVRVPPLNVNTTGASVSTSNLLNNNIVASTTTITTTVTSSTTKTSAALTQPMLTALVQKPRNVASHSPVTNVNSANVTIKTEPDTENPIVKTEPGLETSRKTCLQDAVTQSVFYLPELEGLKHRKRKEKLCMMASRNYRRCQACPIYGADLRESLNVTSSTNPENSQWSSAGYVHCLNAFKPFHTSDEYYSRTDSLLAAVHSAEQYVEELQDIFSRFVLCVPAVSAPQPEIHVSHPPPSQLWALKRTQAMLQQELSSKCALLHPIASAMVTQFPDPRLIQYDCGKLQVLDKLLRQLKADHHRVLIFTQMTRMLDVLEAFLNFHGHIYLRLDGTTRVDQRQILMERFNADKRIFCFILSTRSGGIGVNLTGADTVIFYDSDWNPTMDAQAQDRCHRIGQTRDVHIYRLVSEMTVEENILKKANQKRLLGDLAIEGGNFTTAYFKSSTIQDLFNIDVGENDASRRMAEVLDRDAERRRPSDSQLPPSPHEDKMALGALESALAAAEDETDVLAARTAKAEAAADLAEFDENIPLEDGETVGGDPEISRAEQEVNNIMQQLTPVERYAMKFVEETDSAWSAEQLAAAEAEIEQQKREWELGRLQALKEEEERRSRLEDDDDQLLTFSREDSQNQVVSNAGGPKREGRRGGRGRGRGRGGRGARIHVEKLHSSGSDSENTSATEVMSLNSEESDAGSEYTGVDSDSDLKSNGHFPRTVPNNHHIVNSNSPRTRSRGTVSINLWTLDVSPILPGVKPVGTGSGRTPASIARGRGIRYRRGSGRGLHNSIKSHDPQITPRRPSQNSNSSGPYSSSPTPYSNPNLVIRTRRASVTPSRTSENDISSYTSECIEIATPKRGARGSRLTRRSDHSIEGNGPIT
ncbi:Uncharacterized protein GBIM_12836 [Gryllus bimaculatus]|nr:Uncharacterized protein GBIM_12836 [Gryllus bimaculatus]